MALQFKPLARGKDWDIEWLLRNGQESICFTFNNSTFIDSAALDAIRQHRAWHFYCSELWSGADLSVFAPVADIVEKIALPARKTVPIIGLDSLINLREINISGHVDAIDFTKFANLRSLMVNEQCRGGNWPLCASLDTLSVNVTLPNLTKLAALKNLRVLSCGRGLKSFQGISGLPSLTELRIAGTHLNSLETLGNLPNLEFLLLNLMPKLQTLKGIEGLTALTTLDVTQCGSLRDVTSISTLTTLKKLELYFCPHIKTLVNIKLPADCKIDFQPNGKVSDGF